MCKRDFANLIRLDDAGTMRKSFLIVIFISLCALGGCDMFRKIAGRPTSDELERKRVEIEEDRARAAVLEAERMTMADSLAVVDSIHKLSGAVRGLSDLGGLSSDSLEFRYYIIVGSFRSGVNADALLKNVEKSGYSASLICFSNGLMAVGIQPSDSAGDIFRSLKKVKGESFCPEDVWILVNE